MLQNNPVRSGKLRSLIGKVLTISNEENSDIHGRSGIVESIGTNDGIVIDAGDRKICFPASRAQLVVSESATRVVADAGNWSLEVVE